MRYKFFWLLLFAASFVIGCGQPSAETEETDADVPVVELGTEDNVPDEPEDSSESSDATSIWLTPRNMTIGFVRVR